MVQQIFRITFMILLVGITNLDLKSQELKTYNEFADLKNELFNKQDNKVHVINFWATWCKPCVKELPYIDALSDTYGEEIAVTLVSLDFPRKVETKLKPFLLKNQLKSDVVLLDDGKVNEWIDQVDPSWSGAIPATVFFYNGKKMFFEKEFHSKQELEEVITQLKNNK